MDEGAWPCTLAPIVTPANEAPREGLSVKCLMMRQSRLKRLENNDKIARGAGRANFRKWDS
jgi:hypothetical protein